MSSTALPLLALGFRLAPNPRPIPTCSVARDRDLYGWHCRAPHPSAFQLGSGQQEALGDQKPSERGQAIRSVALPLPCFDALTIAPPGRPLAWLQLFRS